MWQSRRLIKSSVTRVKLLLIKCFLSGMKISRRIFSFSGLWTYISQRTADTQSTLTLDFGSKAVFPQDSKPFLLLSKGLSLLLNNAWSSGKGS